MKDKHEKPSASTILYWLVQDKKISPEVFFDLLEFIWPAFIKKDGFILVKDGFFEEEYQRLINENANPEYWMNLLTVDDFFSELPDSEEKSRTFAKMLTSIWATKLKVEFPDMNFTVQYLHDEEYGDFGLTFYQIKKNNVGDVSESMPSPNIKESRIEQSANGPRPGIPKIRKPRAHEIPMSNGNG